jgi:putative ABC transport system permease protein
MGRHVTGGYFELLGIPLMAGRGFEAADGKRQPVPVVINRRAAQELFGDTPAVGKLLNSNYRSRSTMVIVGVAGDTRQLALTEAPGPQIYVPAQFGSSRVLLIRTEAGTAYLPASIRRLVRNLDPEVPAPEVRSLQGNFERYVARPRFYASLVGAYAVTGLLLAALGVYGLTSYTVARRMNEFGIRISLGATPGDIAGLVLSDGLQLMLAGAVIGTCGAVIVTRLLASVVYGGTPNDPGTIAMVLMLLVGVGLFACWLGARRAARANAAVVLRAE